MANQNSTPMHTPGFAVIEARVVRKDRGRKAR